MSGYTSVPSLPNSQISRASTAALSQQSTLVGSNAFRGAVSRFRARLSGTELTEFKSTTYEILCHEIMRIQYEQEAKKSMMNLGRIQSFLEAMHQFSKTIEVFLNVSDAVAFVWGPVKFLLLTASVVTDSFETLLDAYYQIGEQLPLLQEYEDMFDGNPHMVLALESMYIDILEFHQQAMRFFSGGRWKKFFRSMWKDFDAKFNGILKSLARHKDLVESRATVTQYRAYRDDMDEMKSKLEELITEQRVKKMSTVKEWLAAGRVQEEDHEGFQLVRSKYPSTGKWILGNKSIEPWMKPGDPGSPLIWLNGIPGAGKTILASTIIEECQKDNNFITGYFYCHYEIQGCNTAVGVLKGLVYQLLNQHPDLLPHCYTRRTTSGEPVLRSLQIAKNLFEDFSSIQEKMFIIIDGVDECEKNEQKQLLEFLVDIVSQCDVTEAGKLRVMIVSQDTPEIRKALHSSSTGKVVPTIVSLSPEDNEDDIKTYVSGWVNRIAAKFDLIDEGHKEYLRHLTVARAKGMFLYARLVLENLFQQLTKEDFMDAVTNHFPDGLQEAYARIVDRIKRDFRLEWPRARKLLGWMVCAQRQLTWKEIQVALSINTDEQTIEFEDRRLRMHIYDICGSLVYVSGHRVSLVHSTARYYLTRFTEGIHQPSIECELATLCLQYLTFPCFKSDEQVSKPDLHRMMLQGYFAFQDYAIAKWFHHVTAFINSGPDLLKDYAKSEELLRGISIAIDDFLEFYQEENFHSEKNLVAECRTSCKPFESQEFFEDMVSLTSHIYIFQKKGFDARHKVSIKKLEMALERNRKLMEETAPKLVSKDLSQFEQFYDKERPFKCSKITCMYFSEGFKDAKIKKRHINIHERPFQCEVADCLGAEGFTNSKDLEKHTRLFHPEISDLGQRFNAAADKRAKATHTCTLCGKSFTRKLILQDHVNSHKGIRSYKCEECQKAFTRKNDLTRHKKIHG